MIIKIFNDFKVCEIILKLKFSITDKLDIERDRKRWTKVNVGFTPSEIWFSNNFAWELKGGVFAHYSSPYVELQKKEEESSLWLWKRLAFSQSFPYIILICTQWLASCL